MKAFQSTRGLFESLGVVHEPPQNNSFVWNIFLIVDIAVQYSSIVAYFLFGANTPTEFADSFYAVATSTLLLYTWIVMIQKRIGILQLFDEFEHDGIEKSE